MNRRHLSVRALICRDPWFRQGNYGQRKRTVIKRTH